MLFPSSSSVKQVLPKQGISPSAGATPAAWPSRCERKGPALHVCTLALHAGSANEKVSGHTIPNDHCLSVQR